jgi:hypothetical protein
LPETGSEGSADVLISAVTTESTNLGKGWKSVIDLHKMKMREHYEQNYSNYM